MLIGQRRASGHLATERAQASDLRVDLRHAPAEEVFRGLARAGARVTDGEQVADVTQPKSESLGALNESQPIDRPIHRA